MDTDAYLKHPLIKPDSLKPRLYQQTLAAAALSKSTLVTLPTGMGKTILALMVAVGRMHKFPDKKILFLTPTKPLAQQHQESFRKYLAIPEEQISLFTGEVPPEERQAAWEGAKVVMATPQTIERDAITNRLDLSEVSLIIFDEAHRAVGDYAYVFIAEQYVKKAKEPMTLGLTASPGSSKAKIDEVCKNLCIGQVEMRTEKDPDVQPYIQQIDMSKIIVELPKPYLEVKALFEEMMYEALERLGMPRNTTKRRLLEVQKILMGKVKKNRNSAIFADIVHISAAIKLYHMDELLGTQGLGVLRKYIGKMECADTKSAKMVFNDDRFQRALDIIENNIDLKHPKVEKLVELLKEETKDKNKKIIVFTHYREMARSLIDELAMHGISAERFIGQSTRDGESGLTQKEQGEMLDGFRNNEFQVLLATSVGEEGIDIPAVDLVVFYEPVPSEIRYIQRRGRTGRNAAGKVVILMAKGTKDEAYFWSTIRKELKMKELMNKLDTGDIMKADAQATLDRFVRGAEDEGKIIIYADHREAASDVLRELSRLGAEIRMQTLEVGDFILSDRTCIERKTCADFLGSLINGRLLTQMDDMKRNFHRPVLMIEGTTLFSERNIHPNAIRGALASIAVDYGIPIIQTDGGKETAEMLYTIAKREQEVKKREIAIRGEKKGFSLAEQQQYLVEGLPNIGPSIAKGLLRKFRTVEKVFTAARIELEQVEKIGEKKAAEIRRILTEEYKDEG